MHRRVWDGTEQKQSAGCTSCIYGASEAQGLRMGRHSMVDWVREKQTKHKNCTEIDRLGRPFRSSDVVPEAPTI